MDTLSLMASTSWSVLGCVVKRAVGEMARCRRLSDALTSVGKQPDIHDWSMMPWRRLRRKGETRNQWQDDNVVSWPQEVSTTGKKESDGVGLEAWKREVSNAKGSESERIPIPLLASFSGPAFATPGDVYGIPPEYDGPGRP